MKIRLIAAGFALGLGAALVTAQAVSKDPPASKEAAPKSAMQQPSPEEMAKGMQAWMEAMKPGEPHKDMLKAVGEWDTVTRMWMMGPDNPPTQTKGASTIKSVLGGRFLLQEDKTTFPMPDMATGKVTDMPWNGMGMFGYDNYQKVYVGCWADTMGTQLLTMRGSLDPAGTSLTMYGEMDEPMLGVRGRMIKFVTKFIDDDHNIFSVYDLHVGENYKVVEVEYTRKKK